MANLKSRSRSRSQKTIDLASERISNSPVFLILVLLTGLCFLFASILLALSYFDSDNLRPTGPMGGDSKDAKIWQQAFELSDQNQHAHALEISRKARSQTLAPVLQWREITSGRSISSLEEINDFMNKYSNFPGATLLEIARRSLAAPRLSPAEMLEYYRENPPVNFAAKLHLLEIMAAQNQKAEAIERARKIWTSQTLFPTDQRKLLNAFGDHFTQEDHLKRLNHLMTHGARNSTRRLLPHLPENWQKFATAWANQTGEIAAEFRLHPVIAIPKVLEADEQGNTAKAIGILESIPETMRLPEYEWRARHIIVRELIKKQRFDEAYRIALNHGLFATNGELSDTISEANWLAGWIALTRMGLTFSAQQSFETALSTAKSANWKAQSAYWLATTFQTQRQKKLADELFEQCSAFPHTYYGQLCLSQQSKKLFRSGLPIGQPHLDPNQFADGRHADLLAITQKLIDFDLQTDASKFLHRLAEFAKTLNDVATIRTIARSSDLTRTILKLSWSAADAGFIELSAMLPVLEANLVAPIDLEMSLLQAIASYESALQVDVISPKGALGAMQVMPNTAEAIADKLKIEWQQERMTQDPGYNLTIGGAFLSQMVERYQGNLLLSIAAYNAGPGNVDRWIDDFGDPGTSGIDAEIWVESIPFRETRNYVKDVIARYNLYRAYLSKQPVSIFTSRYLSSI